VIAGVEEKAGLFRVDEMVEKPEPAAAPSNFAIIGRYILTPAIFEVLRNTAPGRNGEVQLTDALQTLASRGEVLACRFDGKRFDCGSIEGYIDATNVLYRRTTQSQSEQ
jgi:UTP--glucose-1-phosphate uridylyltransferase